MLPKNLKYQNKVESASANAYTSNIAPQNGTGPYSSGQTIIINIPTRSNLCLIGSESTLKFSLTVTPAATAQYVRLDRGGANVYGLLMANLILLQKYK